MPRRLRILAVAPALPRPDCSAGDRRFTTMLGLLAKQHRVTLYCVNAPGSSPDAIRYRLLHRNLGIGIVPTNDLPAWKLTQRFQQVLYGACFEVVLFEFWPVAEHLSSLVRRCQPWAKVLVDTVDVHFLREEAALGFGHSTPQEVAERKTRELGTYCRADAVIVVTPEDQAALALVPAMSELLLVPIIVPVIPRAPRSREQELLFVGGFAHLPNVDGLLWFVREVWPILQIICPDVRLTVVGSHPPPDVLALARLPGICVVGYVPHTAPYLAKAAVSIAPLRYGAGMKGKVCEAMAAGVPVVTTSFGAQGLGAVSDTHLIIADSAAGFAHGTQRLLQSPRRAEEIGLAGQQLIQAICSPEAVARRLGALAAHLGEAAPARPALLRWLAESIWFNSGLDTLLSKKLRPLLGQAKRYVKRRFASYEV